MPSILTIGTPLDTASTADTIYTQLRHDILSGVYPANARLKVSDLAKRHDTSTNPVREALQQLRGEGLVIISPNQGARVRPIDMKLVRDVAEVGYLLEPYLIEHFVETASQEDIAKVEATQAEIEALNFADKARHTLLDHVFHERMYENHYNHVAFALWKQHREIMASISTRVPIALGRREAILREHRELIEAIRKQDLGRTVEVLKRHVWDAGRHLVDQLRIEQDRATRS